MATINAAPSKAKSFFGIAMPNTTVNGVKVTRAQKFLEPQDEKQEVQTSVYDNEPTATMERTATGATATASVFAPVTAQSSNFVAGNAATKDT